jgi:predicted PurR-regulated permease PerM
MMDGQYRNAFQSPQRGALIFLALALLALAPLLVQIARPFLTPFLLASILAIVINPANNWVSRRVRRPGLAAFLTTLAAGLLLGIVVTAVGFALTQQLTTAYEALSRRSLEEGGWPALVANTADRVVEAFATRLPVHQEAIRAEILERMKAVTGYLLKNVGGAVGGVTTILITGLLVTIFLYFLLRYGAGWVRNMAALVPLDPSTTARLFQTVQDSVVANVNGVLVVAAAQGLLLSLGFWFIGLRSPLLWGAIGGAASIIPLVGSPLIWVPVVIAFVVMGSYWKALILALWGALVVGSIDNVLRSVVVGARAKQHPVLVALAVVGGTYTFGVLGILLGPLVVSLIVGLVKEIERAVSASRLAASPAMNEGMQPPAGTADQG